MKMSSTLMARFNFCLYHRDKIMSKSILIHNRKIKYFRLEKNIIFKILSFENG